MSEETLYAFGQTQSRREIAADLRLLAAQLDGGDEVTFTSEEQTVVVTPADRPTFEIEIERDRPDNAETGELSIELEWFESAADEDPRCRPTRYRPMKRRRRQLLTAKPKRSRAAVDSTCIGIGLTSGAGGSSVTTVPSLPRAVRGTPRVGTPRRKCRAW
ncbi:MAG TPA: amphi-Trp domain-containing protein [Halococcus sp.]|nr:amphi-Trp domain-containing protein [Halococcus sp.]